MTYVDWCENNESILAQADKYNKFAEAAQWVLLSNIGPRIAKLGRSMYMGAGFHYSIEQRFSKLVDALALPWQPCANHLEKIENDYTNIIITKVLYRALLKHVKQAEKSVKEWRKQTIVP